MNPCSWLYIGITAIDPHGMKMMQYSYWMITVNIYRLFEYGNTYKRWTFNMGHFHDPFSANEVTVNDTDGHASVHFIHYQIRSIRIMATKIIFALSSKVQTFHSQYMKTSIFYTKYTVHSSRGRQLSIRAMIDYCCTIALDVSSLRPSDAYTHRQTNHHWFRWCLASWTAPSHYLNQCWNMVNWTPRNKLQLFLIAINIFSFQKMY